MTSLGEVILMIADEMIKEADDLKEQNEFIWMTLRNYAKQLKVAVKASGADQESPSLSVGGDATFLHPDAQHFQMIEKARKEVREQRKRAEAQADAEGRHVPCSGGPADKDMVPVPQEMPLGAKTLVDGAVYVLGAEGLCFSAEETAKLRGGG